MTCIQASPEVQYPKFKHEKEPFWTGGGAPRKILCKRISTRMRMMSSWDSIRLKSPCSPLSRALRWYAHRRCECHRRAVGILRPGDQETARSWDRISSWLSTKSQF